MSFFFHKPKTPASTPPTKLANMDITQAVIGKALPILMGTRRLSQSLIYYADFTAIPHVQKTSSGGGGKGLGGGGGSDQTTTTYTYTAATLGALCSGPVGGIVNVWDTKGRFQQTNTSENFTIPGGGGSYQVVNHGLYKVDHGVGFARSYSQTVDDFGSPGSTTLSGTFQVPMTGQQGTSAPGPGEYAYDPSTGTYYFHASDAGKSVTINYSYNLLDINNTETATIPNTPFQILVQDATDFLQDSGVVFYPSGTALTKVAASPAAGQYTVTSGGLYTFNSADATKQVQISYITHTQNQQSDAPTALNITLLSGGQTQPAWSYLISRHPEAALGYTETALIAASALDLGSQGEVPNYSFEIAGPYRYGSGIKDCDPADCINALLTDQFFGIGFPSSAIGDWTQASDFWVANSFFISPLIDSQTSVSSVIGSILESGMTAGFWSEGLFKLVPYGDTSAAGNGQIFIPNTQPIVDLTDDDFIGDGLVKVTRTSWQDAHNKVQVTWKNRLNGYNDEVTTEQDDAAIQRYGLRQEDPQNWDSVTTLAAAQFAANLRVKRSVNIRAQYTFSVKSNYSYLEPMDLVTITVPELGWTKLPVRITRIVDHPDENGLEITAEEFPWGTAQPTLYGKQVGSGFTPNVGQADPGNTTAMIFEAPNRLGMQAGNTLYGFCSGSAPDWGGCQPYVSYDGVNYTPFGPQITGPARLGSLSGTLGAGTADPDTTHNAVIVMSNSSSTLPAASQSDFDAGVSLCVLTGQGIKYNVIPDSGGDLLTWTTNASLPIVFGITGISGGAWRYTGTGAASGFLFVNSPVFTVIPGQTYTFSAYIDATHVTSGAPDWAIYDPTITTAYASFGQTPGVNGRVSVTFTVPTGVTQVVALLDTDNCVVASGQNLLFYNPQVEQGTTVTTWQSTSSNAFELFSYRDSTLSGQNQYTLSTLHRGLVGTTNQFHSSGETFARLDQASFTYQYDPSYYGKTIYFKFPSFNTVGGRPQPLSQAAGYSFKLQGSGPGAIDLNTGIYRPGQGNTQSTTFPSFTITRNTTSLTIAWSGNLTRGTVPQPNQSSSAIDSTSLSGSITITGLTAGTNYWFYPYVDDLTGTPTVKFVDNSVVSGGTGTSSSGAIAYTATNSTASQLQQRNDHASLGVIATSTTSSGTSSGSGGGGGITGPCPRYDMVVLHRDHGIVQVGTLQVGDYIWGRENGTDQWLRVREMNRKMRRDWVQMDFDCGEEVVVTPNHVWPTDKGHTMTSEVTPEHVFYQTEGRTFLNGWHKLRGEAECIGMELESLDHAYYIGRQVPKVLTQNGFVLPS
jgi:Putative phage tail protein